MQVKVVVHEAEEGGFWAEVPALPGCASQGETMDELPANLRERSRRGWQPSRRSGNRHYHDDALGKRKGGNEVRKDEAVRLLREHAGAIRAIGARSLYLFGSTTRGEARAASDVNLFVDYDEDSDFSAIELVRIQRYISDLLRTEADVTTREGLHPLIRADIIASAEKVF